MPKYVKNPVIIEAHQWLKNGDHPQDNCYLVDSVPNPFMSEGEVVRYYRRPEINGLELCQQCANTLHEHGWIDTLEGGHVVCPGDFIITGVEGEHYPCKPRIFAKTYTLVEDK